MKALTKKHKAVRIASAILTVALILMVLIGVRYARSFDPRTALAYWALCAGLVMGVLALALMDVRHILMSYSEERKKVLRNLAEGEKDE